ncbi:MAG: DNA polymerase IV [Proteobacteria bacterium]|nr:DNA polymerase IV [Pseudomonadota bacterium]MBU1688018.1 DNA polymerase IV [Pseudomonadota bacterium]
MNSLSGQDNQVRTIIHLDMDAFYASVEELDNPEYRGKPLVVGGLSDRSVVSAASYAARKFGIHSAMPMTQAKKLCPHGFFLPIRMRRYQELSSHIMDIFHRITPIIEPISLDEAFLDVTGSIGLFGPGPEIARKLKEMIKAETGLTGSAGVASSKLVAKIASDLEKPDGLTIVPVGHEAAFLDPLPIGKLWGVGRTTMATLNLMGIRTIGDLGRMPENILTAKFGKHGRHMSQSARGIDPRWVETTREAKSIGNEETFATDLTNQEHLKRELLALAIRVGKRLRSHGLAGKTVTIKVKYHDFKIISRAVTLVTPTNDGKEIFRQGRQLLSKTEAGKKPVRLLGISVSNLGAENAPRQGLLFGHGRDRSKPQELNRAMDRITEKYGNSGIRPGTLMKKNT